MEQDQGTIDFSIKKNMHSTPSSLSSFPSPLPPLSTSLLPIPENNPEKVLSSLTSREQFALLSSYSGKKGRWCVSCESVGEERNVCISLHGCIKSERNDRTGGQSLYNEDNVAINK